MMPGEKRRLNEINQQDSASTWLTTLPIKEQGYTMNKNCFWDLLRLRYGWQLQRLPTTCVCGRAPWTTFHHGPCSFMQERLYKFPPQPNKRSYSQLSKDHYVMMY